MGFDLLGSLNPINVYYFILKQNFQLKFLKFLKNCSVSLSLKIMGESG
jgi:hypothetical protein